MATAVDPLRLQNCPTGCTGVFALTADPRFSFCLYVPPKEAGAPRGLVVTVHHTLRNFIECRDAFAGFAEAHRLVVLAPLFPINVCGDGNADGYKYLEEGEIRYDLLLNDMVDTVRDWTGGHTERFFLQGYSGGAHFAHRYLLLHPQRVRAASVGAPGEVTLLDFEAPWWAGVQGMEQRFGRGVDLAALRRVPLQLLVGDQDTDSVELEQSPDDRYPCPVPQRSGGNRIERLRALQRSWQAAGIETQLELMPGVRHGDGTRPAIERAERFFTRYLESSGADDTGPATADGAPPGDPAARSSTGQE